MVRKRANTDTQVNPPQLVSSTSKQVPLSSRDSVSSISDENSDPNVMESIPTEEPKKKPKINQSSDSKRNNSNLQLVLGEFDLEGNCHNVTTFI